MARFSQSIRLISLLLIRIGVCLSGSKYTRNSLDDDLLLPYAVSHGPSHSHRHVRDCQPVVHGNVTHETWPANDHTGSPVAESKIFVSDMLQGDRKHRWATGHITVVHNPLRTLSILEPGGPGGCDRAYRELVENTAKIKKCLFAQNAGYFNTHSGECLGNVISDGKLVKDSHGIQNAQFGIRRDGTLVFGYLSEEDVLDQVNPFVQLVSGVVWLLRAGKVYINESMAAECDKTEETGSFQRFVDVVSARTAIGHDAEGNLILFHIDGKTDQRGMNLWEVANFLKDEGVVNAINLDGGGSATYVVNGALANYPSDECVPRQMWRCPRPVSTVVCVHEPACEPEDCSGHGTCVDGQCVCQDGWSGTACDRLTCQSPACGGHGLCTQYGCACDAGWTGSNCSQVCAAGFYGDGCNQTCTCANGGSCDPVHGSCTCLPGFHGNFCELECPLGFYGLNCLQQCDCEDMCPCDSVTGSCNITFSAERNNTLHRAGHCLAKQMWREWKQEEIAQKQKSYLREQTWLIISAVLATLLLASVSGNLIQKYSKSGAHPSHKDYSYVPLGDMTRSTGRGRGQGGRTQPVKPVFQQDESDSQDSS
ncbi:N-acetylglucosamine-1-phosphodiester alpha-N-acetylglucosaminidase [Chanos chanos]|uniref:N-acetylglucosamine-1-phosphodiester alpha-N-acetylglucosaminidase n=1 Tax=Chanos chanos TaxID=29144 RepID=A0A6J2W2E1_CHACN|nr:N-acetylglucosamine-1-phosphodiester alpha-N-acetylglucosaminidase [Chanos chanos]